IGSGDEILGEARRHRTQGRAVESLDELAHAKGETLGQNKWRFRIRSHRGEEHVTPNERADCRFGSERSGRVSTPAEHWNLAERSAGPFDVHDLHAISPLANDPHFAF